MVVPPREISCVLVDEVPAETVAVGVDIQFIVFVLSHQLGRIERHVERKAQITNPHAEGGFVVGCQFRFEMFSDVYSLRLNLRPREVIPDLGGPLRLRPCDIGRVDVAFLIFHGQHTVHPMKDVLRG